MHCVSSQTLPQSGQRPPVLKVSQIHPQLHCQYGCPSGSHLHLGQQICILSIVFIPPTLKRAFYPKRLKGLDKIYLSKYQHFQYNVKLAQAFECKDKKEHLSLLSLGLGFFFPFTASVSTFRHLVRNRTLFKSTLSITASLSNACVWHLAWNSLNK